MTGKKSRNKGAAFEREVARMIHEHLGIDVRRNLTQYQEKGHGDLVGWPGVLIECKRHAATTRAQVEAWWQETLQAAEQAKAHPVLIYKTDRHPIRVVLRASDLMETITTAWAVEMAFAAFCEAAREVWIR